MKTIAPVTLTIVSVLQLFAPNAQAAHRRDIPDVAHALRDQAALVCHELNDHFRHTPQYRHLYKDVYEMYSLAGHVHKTTHRRAGLHHIKNDLRQLDKAFHHVEEVLAEFKHSESRRRGQHVSIGKGSFQIRIGSYGVDKRRLHRLSRMVDEMGVLLHELQETVKDQLRHQSNKGVNSRLKYGPVVPPSPNRRRPTASRSTDAHHGETVVPSRRSSRGFLFSLGIR